MATKKFSLDELVSPPSTDSISGRDFGISYAQKIHLLEILEQGDNVEFTINEDVKAINDSFIKGVFSQVFEKYKKIEAVRERVKIIASDYFVRLFEKNWFILQEVNNV